jgi:uncharacterized protein (DUF302 family)
LKKLLLTVLFCFATSVVQAEDIMMVRTRAAFPEAMSALQNSIIEHQYTLSRVQRVDIGLSKAGYTTDRYRVVFYGKYDEVKAITERYPQMNAYLPLMFTIFAEGDETLVAAYNPEGFRDLLADRQSQVLVSRWKNDIRSILQDVAKAE